METYLQLDRGFDSLEEICHLNVAKTMLPAGHFWSGQAGLVVAVPRAELLIKNNSKCHLWAFFLNLNNLHTSEYSWEKSINNLHLDKKRHINRKASSEPVSSLRFQD